MLGFGDHHDTAQSTLPVLVHAVQSAAAWDLAQKIWQTNSRSVVADGANRKELLHFAFSNPSCIAWLQRDQGRTDTFELILMWQEPKAGITEVYVLSDGTSQPKGDDTRVRSLLASMLASPATVPVTKAH